MPSSDNEYYVASSRRTTLTSLMQETIVTLCRNMMKFKEELSIEGLLGITVDKTQVILLNMKEVIAVEKPGRTDDLDEGQTLSNFNAKTTNFEKWNLRKRPRRSSIQKNFVDGAVCKSENMDRVGSTPETEKISSDGIVTQEDGAVSASASLEEDPSRVIVKNVTENQIFQDPDLCHVNGAMEDLDSGGVTAKKASLNDRRRRRYSTRSNAAELKDDAWNDCEIKCENIEPSYDELPNCYQSMNETSRERLDFAAYDEYRSSSERWFDQQSISTECCVDEDGFAESDLLSFVEGVGTDDRVVAVGNYRCKLCRQTFTTKQHVKRHVNTIHSQVALLSHCPICRKAFRRRDSMMRHYKSIHSREETGGGCTQTWPDGEMDGNVGSDMVIWNE